MDPGAMMNEGSFVNGGPNTTPYNLADIWQLPMNIGAGLGDSGVGLGLRRPQFGHNLGLPPFSDFSGHTNRDVPRNDQTSSEQRANNNDDHGVNNNKKRRDFEDESTKGVSTSNDSDGMDGGGEGKRLKASGNKNESRDTKAEAQPRSGKPAEQHNQPLEPPKQDYIHVRARRGQATDSHSLAERARREKISERMKILQDLVPGCNKVIGKALVLDEIINYIQSLQRQVEFLSMKLEAVNSRLNSGIDVFPPKDFGQQSFETAGMAFGSQATREYSRGSSPEWLHMQVGGGFERTS